MHYSAMDIVSICVHAISGLLGILGNVALLVSIAHRSPVAWKSYTVLLNNSALVDLVACFSSLMSIERFVPFKDVTTSVYVGPCILVSGFACHILHSIFFHLINHSFLLIVLSFCFRHYVIERPHPSKWNTIFICVVFYFPSFLILIMTFFTNDSPGEVRSALRLLHPDHDQFVGYVIEGHVDIKFRLVPRLIMAYAFGSIAPNCMLVFVVRKKVINKICKMSHAMSPRTMDMHNTLVKVLTLQASLPILCLLTVISGFLVKLQIYDSPFLEYSMIWYMTFMPAAAPFVTLYNIKPFRNFILPTASTSSSGKIGTSSSSHSFHVEIAQ